MMTNPRNAGVVFLAIAAGLLVSNGIRLRSAGTAAATVRYQEVKDWPRLPVNVAMGEAAGVAVDATGNVLVFHRPGRGFDPAATELLKDPAVLEFDAETGRLIRAWGANTFLVPHGISIDRENNVFLTDVGLQQVFKFAHDGTLMFAIGEPRVGKWDATHFNQPTDIAIRADGSFYVSDGYINSRVAMFDRNGKWQREWGRKGAGTGEFSNPHGLAFIAGTTDVIVADRENSRLQLFDRVGTFKQQWTGAGDAQTTARVFSVATDADGALYLGVRRADYDSAHTGVLKLDRDWRIVAAVGFGKLGDPVFNAVHDLAIGPDGSIYVAETRTKRVVKLRPVPAGPAHQRHRRHAGAAALAGRRRPRPACRVRRAPAARRCGAITQLRGRRGRRLNTSRAVRDSDAGRCLRAVRARRDGKRLLPRPAGRGAGVPRRRGTARDSGRGAGTPALQCHDLRLAHRLVGRILGAAADGRTVSASADCWPACSWTWRRSTR